MKWRVIILHCRSRYSAGVSGSVVKSGLAEACVETQVVEARRGKNKRTISPPAPK